MYVERRDADTSVIAPCCAARGQVFPNNEINFDTNAHLQKLREENSQGIASAECQVCWDQEKYTGKSLRTGAVEYYKNHHEPGLKNIDWNVEPICNAKCIICSNYHSSLWLAEDQKFEAVHPIQRTAASARTNDIVDGIDFSNLIRIYFNGGEPVLSKDPVRILQKLADLGKLDKIETSLNMNGSQMMSAELVALLKQSRYSTVFFSIDGTGDQFEYIRNPIPWSNLESNLKRVLDLGFNSVIMTTALGVHNLQIAQDIERWWKNFTQQYQPMVKIANTYQLVVGPLSFDNVSSATAAELLKEIEEFKDTEEWAKIGYNSLQNAQGTDQWLPWLEKLDQRRGLDWKQTLPSLYASAVRAGITK